MELRFFLRPKDGVVYKGGEQGVVSNIGDTPTGAIVKQYIKTEPFRKQVFIALDKTESYGEETDKDLNDHQVLYLSEDGNELFGWSWDHRTGEN